MSVKGKEMDIKRVGVVGCGIMGSGIAQAAAVSGFEARFVARSEEKVERDIQRIRKSFSKAVKKNKLSQEESDRAMGKIHGTDKLEDRQENVEADAFAGYFLMPQEAFMRQWEVNRGLHFVDRVMKVKRHFQVSYKTVLFRLVEMGELDESIWHDFPRYYRGHFGKDLPRREPFPLDEPDFEEDRLDQLVHDALAKNMVADDKKSGLLLSNGYHVLRMRCKTKMEAFADLQRLHKKITEGLNTIIKEGKKYIILEV